VTSEDLVNTRLPSALSRFLLPILLVAAMASFAFAEIVQIGYRQLRGTAPSVATVHDEISSVQTQNFTATPLDPHPTNSNQKIAASVTFSNSAATCELTLALYHRSSGGTYTLLGIAKSVTITADTADVNAGGRYLGTTMAEFDTFAANYYDLRVRTISAGDVSVVHYPYGAATRDGE
jgi:hypothetical protein